MVKLPAWVSNDLARQRLATRLQADLDVSKTFAAHKYVKGAHSSSCLSCGFAQVHPIHDDQIDWDTRESLTPSPLPIPVDQNDPEAAAEEHSGMMIALFLDPALAKKLAVKGGEKADSLHVTLVYLPDNMDRLRAVALKKLCEGLAQTLAPLSGRISGKGVFRNEDEGHVTYASVDLPGLPEFRQRLVSAVRHAGFTVALNHGFTPHVTLGYANKEIPVEVGGHDLVFDDIVLMVGKDRTDFKLVGKQHDPEMSQDLLAFAKEIAKAKPKLDHNYTHPQFIPKSGIDSGEGKRTPITDAGIGTGDTIGEADFNVLPPCASCGMPFSDHIPMFSGNGDFVTDDDDNQKASGLGPGPIPADPDMHLGDGGPILSTPAPLGGNGPLLSKPSALKIATVKVNEPHFKPEAVPAVNEPQRAFVTEIFGKTILTAAASTDLTQWEKAATPNKHMMWVQGRFVGAEKANRNGALWSTADLEMGAPTVTHGPLNWLHEAKHIVGALADQRLITPGTENASAVSDPYIAVLAGVWRWIYPDEAWVIEQASDQDRSYFSMECVSDSVECAGDSGCGASAKYTDYLSGIGGTCSHMRERSGVRRFSNPTFLGGAIIVPPVRPGWADANAQVLQQAALLAEKSYEDAGRPDVPASVWETLMAGVVAYALT